MPIGELSLPSWLGPGEPAGAPLLRGAQAGGIMRSSFLAARQQKMREAQMPLEEEEKRALIAGQYLNQRATQQNMQLTAIKIADALKNRDDEVASESALSTFGERIRRAKILGPNEPSAQQGVLDWAEQYRGLLTTPAGKSLWDDYMQSVDEDRKHAAQIATLKLGIDERAAGAAAMMQARNVQAFDMEQFKQQNRVLLETKREQFRRELATDPAASHVSEDQWVNRHLNSFVGPAPIGRDETIEQRGLKFAAAEKSLRDMYREAHATNAVPRAVTTPASAPATTKSLSRDQAIDFLRQAGGDKDKARKMARDAGYSF